MEWSPQQDRALLDCQKWLSDPHSSQVFYLAGFAGTGKTTLAKHFVQGQGRWLFGAFTGKAAHVLRSKGCKSAETIHSLIYKMIRENHEEELSQIRERINRLESKKPNLTNTEQRMLLRLHEERCRLADTNKPIFSLSMDSELWADDVRGIVIDEVSMVDGELGRDLELFGKRILVIGDPGQLPPIDGAGYFTERRPDVMLTEVHRQAEQSGILQLATAIRNDRPWQCLTYDDVEIVDDLDEDQALHMEQILVGTNVIRQQLNRRFRGLLGITEPGPVQADFLVALRNNRLNGIYNGSQWTVKYSFNDYHKRTAIMGLVSEDAESKLVEVLSWLHYMIDGDKDRDLRSMSPVKRLSRDVFDFAYAMTVHKAQGSQWDKVLLLDQSLKFRQHAQRWLYTAVTRAAKKLVVVKQ